MQNLGSEIGRLTKELQEYRAMYARAWAEIVSLHEKLTIEEEINDKYRAWFTANAHWTNEHNQRKELSTVDDTKPLE